jgi:hypothetical protein
VTRVPEPTITLAAGLPPLPLVAASILLLFLPGSAVAGLLLPGTRYTLVERLLAAPALTLAALALGTLWASALHVPLGEPVAATALGACLAVLAWRATPLARMLYHAPERRPVWKLPAESMPERLARHQDTLAVVGYLALYVLALGLRLWSTREVLPTLGADTYHHTLIAQLLVERGGLPDSYTPYAPIQSFAYHFGFHSLVAWLHWWTGADVGALTGLTGHLVNAAVALSVAFFVLRRVGDGLAAALAAWLVAFLCVFPAYLVNWGRFTQAAGLVLLPVAAALCIDALGPARNRGAVGQATLAAGIAAGGLALAHYRMAAMLALLLGVWLAYIIWSRIRGDCTVHRPSRGIVAGRAAGDEPLPYAPPLAVSGELGGEWRAASSAALLLTVERQATRRESLARWRHALVSGGGLLVRLGAVGLVAGLLALPWLVRLPSTLSLGLGQQPGDYSADYYGLERLGTAVAQPTNLPLLALAAVGLALACRLHHQPALGQPVAVLVLAAWALAQLALANPRWWPVPMPLAGRVDLVTTLAALCFPLAVAAALALAVAARLAGRQWGRRGAGVALALGLAGTALGGWQLQALVTPANALVAPADLAAAAWLRTHSPPDATIAVSATLLPWAPDYVVGVDGGYWLPLLAGRATTVLPMLYPGERGADQAAVARMVAVAQALRDAPAAALTAALLRSLHVGYVYHSGRSPVPSAEGLASNPGFRVVYDADGVRIWAVAPE